MSFTDKAAEAAQQVVSTLAGAVSRVLLGRITAAVTLVLETLEGAAEPAPSP